MPIRSTDAGSTINSELLPLVAQMKKKMGWEEIPSDFFEAEQKLSGTSFSANIQLRVRKDRVFEHIQNLTKEINRYQELLKKAEQNNYILKD